MQYLFVGGCARSGTTALTNILNDHPRIGLGRERYRRGFRHVDQEFFKPERFFFPESGEVPTRHIDTLYPKLKKRFDAGQLSYLGDKVPRYVWRLPQLRKRFPGCKLIVIQRPAVDVAASYQKRLERPDNWASDYVEAVEHWNRAVRATLRAARKKASDLFIVSYDGLLSGNATHLTALFNFLELQLEEQVVKTFKERTAGWETRKANETALTKEQRSYVEEHADNQAAAEVFKLSREMLDYYALSGANQPGPSPE